MMLRWIAEIISDGTDIRSLSGRSARLADGFSRNGKDRDALLEARTDELKALKARLRGFDLENFITEEPTGPTTWEIAHDSTSLTVDDELVQMWSVPALTHQADMIAAAVGVKREMRVLLLPDYVDPARRRRQVQALWQALRDCMPGVEVSVGVGNPPV